MELLILQAAGFLVRRENTEELCSACHLISQWHNAESDPELVDSVSKTPQDGGQKEGEEEEEEGGRRAPHARDTESETDPLSSSSLIPLIARSTLCTSPVSSQSVR